MFSGLNVSRESRKRRRSTFACGVLCDVLFVGAVFLISELPSTYLPAPTKHYEVTWLPDLTPPQKEIIPPRHLLAPALTPKVAPPEISKPIPIHVTPKSVPETPHPVPIIQQALAHPVITPPNPSPTRQSPIRTGVFGGSALPVTTKRPLEAVQTGGFGDPQGVPGRALGDSPSDVPKLGSFALPEGAGKGNGTGGVHGVAGVVASSGFGSGVAGSGSGDGGSGTGRPKVSMGGFTNAATDIPSARESVHAEQAADFRPVEILSKPDPVYTEEARRLGIQGEVTLSVLFESIGAIRVTGVVKSLGHGLDQAAEHAASQIRFKPAQRGGKPVDFPATLRIEFRLAGQTSF